MSLFAGIIGGALKGGGQQAAQYLEEEQRAQRAAALEAQREANAEARAVRLEAIRNARDDKVYARTRTDAKADRKETREYAIESEEATFQRGLKRETDPEIIRQRAAAAKLEAELAPGKLIPVGPSTDLVNSKDPTRPIYSNTKTRDGANAKESPELKRARDRLESDRKELSKTVGSLEEEAIKATNPDQAKAFTDKATKAREKLDDLNDFGELRLDVKTGKYTPEMAAERILEGKTMTTLEDLTKQLNKIDRAVGADFATKVYNLVPKERFLQMQEQSRSQLQAGAAENPPRPNGIIEGGQKPLPPARDDPGIGTSPAPSRQPGAPMRPIDEAPQTPTTTPGVEPSTIVPDESGQSWLGIPGRAIAAARQPKPGAVIDGYPQGTRAPIPRATPLAAAPVAIAPADEPPSTAPVNLSKPLAASDLQRALSGGVVDTAAPAEAPAALPKLPVSVVASEKTQAAARQSKTAQASTVNKESVLAMSPDERAFTLRELGPWLSTEQTVLLRAGLPKGGYGWKGVP